MTRNIDHGRFGRVRQDQGEIANHIIDELAAARLSRRDFIRRASVVGISAPLLGSILAACSSSSLTEIFGAGYSSAPSSSGSSTSSASASARGKVGAVIKAGIVTPTAAINPVTVADQGGLDMLAQTGEYLDLVHADPAPEARAGDQLVGELRRRRSGRSRSARASSSITGPR